MLKKLAATGLLGFLVTGLIMTAAAPASAGDISTGDLLSGNEADVAVYAPPTLCGNSIQLIPAVSDGFAECDEGGHDDSRSRHRR